MCKASADRSGFCVCSFGKYELHDLLMLDDGSVGVLIAVAKDSCKVLTNKVRKESGTQCKGCAVSPAATVSGPHLHVA